MTLINRGRTPGPAGLLGDIEDDIYAVQPGLRPRRPGPVGTGPQGALYYSSYADANGGSGSTHSSQPSLPAVKIVEPEPTSSSYVLQPENAPLFNNSPKPDEVIQGELWVCPLAAVLVAVAHANPKKLMEMLPKPTPAQVISTLDSDPKFRMVTDVVMTVQFPDANPIKISKLLYHKPIEEEGEGGGIPYAHSNNGVGWVSFIEKAYVVLRGKNTYQRLNVSPGLDIGQVMGDVVGPYLIIDLVNGRLFTPKGKDMKDTKDEDLSDKRLKDLIKAAAQRPTIAASLEKPPGKTIHKNHGYGVMGFDGKKVQLRNPWGSDAAESPDVALSLEEFKKNFQMALQAAG